MHDQDYCPVPIWRRDGTVAGYALVDAADWQPTMAHRWHSSRGYARRNVGTVAVLLHRVIMGLEPGDPPQVDHINRNRLDNRRANLRLVDHAGQMQNRKAHSHGKSRFRAVYWDPRKKKWRVRPRSHGVLYHVGYFDDERTAAEAAEAWRREHMPFAEPDPELQPPAAPHRYVVVTIATENAQNA